MNATTTAPAPGTPATICMWSDTIAAVVTKVTRTTVTIMQVEVGEYRKGHGDNDTIADGNLDQPIPGTEEIYRLRKDGRYHGGHGRLVFGHSRSRTDWTF